MDAMIPHLNLLVRESLMSFETESVTGYSSDAKEEGVQMALVDMEFNITIPSDLGGRCKKAGDCLSAAC